MVEQITSFTGEYRFLSNFYPAMSWYDNKLYPTSEHAYQAAKTLNRSDRIRIVEADSPSMAKHLGQQVTLRPMWEDLKVGIMHQILMTKFFNVHNPDLTQSLIDTGDAFLEEGNTWGDTFWGVCNGEGLNYLGRILMAIRYELRDKK